MQARAKSSKVPVSERAVIQRINRVLKPKEQVLKLTRGQQMQNECGRWYVLDYNRNCILQRERYNDLEACAREWGCLQDWEVLS